MNPAAGFPQLSDFDLHARLAECGGAALVFFTRAGCAACRHWATLLRQLRQARPEIAVFAVDVEQNMALAREFEIFHLPALHLFVDGEYHAEIQCEARLPALTATLDAALRAEAREAP